MQAADRGRWTGGPLCRRQMTELQAGKLRYHPSFRDRTGCALDLGLPAPQRCHAGWERGTLAVLGVEGTEEGF